MKRTYYAYSKKSTLANYNMAILCFAGIRHANYSVLNLIQTSMSYDWFDFHVVVLFSKYSYTPFQKNWDTIISHDGYFKDFIHVTDHIEYFLPILIKELKILVGRPDGRVVSALDHQSGGRSFEPPARPWPSVTFEREMLFHGHLSPSTDTM